MPFKTRFFFLLFRRWEISTVRERSLHRLVGSPFFDGRLYPPKHFGSLSRINSFKASQSEHALACFRQSEHARALLIRSKGQHFFSYIRHFDLRLCGRPGRDGCQLKVHCGTVLGAKLPPCWKCVPQNSPTMHFQLTTISTRSPAQPQSGEYARSSWLGWETLCPGITVSCPLSLKRKTGDILIAWLLRASPSWHYFSVPSVWD